MNKIRAGVARFRNEVFPKQRALFQKLANGQEPQALFFTCADSRVNPSLLTQTDPGELFICRNIGNIIPPYGTMIGAMTAAIEYAVAVLDVPHIIVCGHSHCGAMKGVLHPETTQGLPHITSWLMHSQAALHVVDAKKAYQNEDERLRALIEENVLGQIQHLQTHPHVAARLAAGKIQLHAWVYEFEKGEVLEYDPQARRFSPLQPQAEEQLVHA